ncbi:MAG: HAMP domain-containing sensor histidine kinase [Myxococcales bacterium]
MPGPQGFPVAQRGRLAAAGWGGAWHSTGHFDQASWPVPGDRARASCRAGGIDSGRPRCQAAPEVGEEARCTTVAKAVAVRPAARRALLEAAALVGLALLLSLLSAWWLGRRLAVQVAALEKVTERLSVGDYTVRAPVHGMDGVARLAKAFNRMARQLEEDRERIVEQQRSIEAANRNYLEMLSFVSHELRSGLGTALFNLALVEEGSFGKLHDEQREGLELVGSSLRYLAGLLDKFLQLSRIERGELLTKKTAVALLRDVVRPALSGLEPQLRERAMQVELSIPEDLDVLGDPSLLRVVYENLVSNAVKYGRPGGRLVLAARRLDGKVELEAWNEGPGIPLERVPHIFRRFERYDVEQVGGRRGSGLGLFIVRQIVRRHGGEIVAESKPGEWARFRICIDAAKPSTP